MTKRTLYLTDEIWERLHKLAKRDGMRVAEMIRRALIEFLERMER